MQEYVIVTDSTSDISADLVDEMGVEVLPLQFEIEGNTYRNYPDEREMKLKDFYQTMRDGKVPKTSQINEYEFDEFFSEYLEKGQDVLYLAFSSGLSGTYAASVRSIEHMKEKYPEREILSVDTLCASMGEGLLVYYAAKKKKEGMGIHEVASWVEENRLKLCHWFTVEDLVYLKRGGRVSAATAVVGAALQIKPVLHVDDEGHLINVSKTRGRKASLNAIVDKIAETGLDKYDTVMISHADCLKDAEYIADQVKSRIKYVKKVIIGDIGPVIGAHAGPGVVALFFFGEKR